jgi:hypothetical protein
MKKSSAAFPRGAVLKNQKSEGPVGRFAYAQR